MRLQADPTSSYGFYKDYGKKIGRAVLDDKNPYNTAAKAIASSTG